MNSWVKGRLPLGYLALIVAVAVIGVGLVERVHVTVRHPAYSEQLAAAQIMQRAIGVIRDFRVSQGLVIDRQLDPNLTGLIGDEYTELTTSLGSLEAKRTSTNPAFAAVMVRYFHDAGLKQGDVVAIGASGSFPALIVASLAAAKAMELRPLIIYSVGSSMYGANIPNLTFVEMLDQLNKAGVFSYRLLALSPGGDLDQAKGLLTPFCMESIAELGKEYGVQVIVPQSLAESIAARLHLYSQEAGEEPIRCFVNIGGASANYGDTPASLKFPNGLVLKATVEATGANRGLIFEYAQSGIPVISLLNINSLAMQNGLPIDPYPMPKVGEGGVYYQVQNRKWLALSFLLAICVLVISKTHASFGK